MFFFLLFVFFLPFIPGFFHGYHAILCRECQWTTVVCHQTSYSCKSFLVFPQSFTLDCTPGAETPRILHVYIHTCVICAYSFAFLHRLTCFFCFYPQVFSRYEKHRQLILEEIFTSLARLPTSKRSLRNFRYALLLETLDSIIISVL